MGSISNQCAGLAPALIFKKLYCISFWSTWVILPMCVHRWLTRVDMQTKVARWHLNERNAKFTKTLSPTHLYLTHLYLHDTCLILWMGASNRSGGTVDSEHGVTHHPPSPSVCVIHTRNDPPAGCDSAKRCQHVTTHQHPPAVAQQNLCCISPPVLPLFPPEHHSLVDSTSIHFNIFVGGIILCLRCCPNTGQFLLLLSSPGETNSRTIPNLSAIYCFYCIYREENTVELYQL